MTATPTSSLSALRVAGNLNQRLSDWLDVLNGHAAVHPDYVGCKGISGCLLLRIQQDALDDLSDALARAAKSGFVLTVGVDTAPADEESS